MKNIILFLAATGMLCFEQCVIAQEASDTVVQIEYFIDSDPGYGLGTPLSFAEDQMIDMDFIADISELSINTTHMLGIRAMDGEGIWGQTTIRMFTVTNEPPSEPKPELAEMEYFIDTDPGFGTASSLNVINDSIAEFTHTFDITDLSYDTVHFVGIRAIDNEGIWGHTYFLPFTVSNVAAALPNLTYIEYFIDSDPDFGNGTKVYFDPDSVWDEEIVIDLQSQSLGNHFLGIRGYEENRKFSHTFLYDFTVVPFYTIVSSFSEGGVIDPAGSIMVNEGSDADFAINPETGHHIWDVEIDGLSEGVITTYNFINVTEDHSIYASFVIDTLTITASAGENGTIDPSGTIYVLHGSDASFIITPDEHYHVADVNVDGFGVGAVEVYDFVNVTANHTIHAQFDFNIFIEETSENFSDIIIYPNPAHDYFYLKYPERAIQAVLSLHIFDLSGRKIIDLPISSDENRVNLSDCKSGLYLIEIVADNEVVATYKLIKR